MIHPQAELLVDLRERMVRIETKLDTHADNHLAIRADVDDHSRRLTVLESHNRLIVSIGAILLFLVTFFQERIALILA